MRRRWERLTFLHWPFEAADVQRLLPDGLEVETREGAAWVGRVPFYMRAATPGGRRVPWVSNFCETNVRTCVRAEFFDVDKSRSMPWQRRPEATALLAEQPQDRARHGRS